MPSALLPVTRRTATGAVAVGLLAVAGCDLGDLDPRSAPEPAGDTPSAPPVDADTTLVAGVVTDLAVMLGETTGAAGGVRRRFRRLARLHQQHLEELEPGTTATPGDGPLSATTLLRHEERLQRRLATAAVAAESGELARILASMSAAVAQQLALLAATEEAR